VNNGVPVQDWSRRKTVNVMVPVGSNPPSSVAISETDIGGFLKVITLG